ncbi:unnamed protein product, partial [Polarella glacialis]
DSSPQRPYRERKNEAKSTVHWGQRKLCLAELEFLTQFASEASRLVYAGAAPGDHLAFLCRLFPEIQVDGYDPRPFSASAVPPLAPPNLRVHQVCFTDEVARQIASEADAPILFVSDIRTADWQSDKESEHDARLLEDLHAQQRWVDLLRPCRALLKFRLPYVAGNTESLDGELRLPVWGPQTTTECRLLVSNDMKSCNKEDPLPTKVYDHQVLSDQLFYFNTVTRISIYPRPAFAQDPRDEERLKSAGLCCCFDCTREVEILASFLMARRPTLAKADLALAVTELSRDISVGCRRGPGGLLDAPAAPWEAAAAAAAGKE